NDARFFIVSSLLPFKRQPESLLSPGIDPHGNGHFASPYGAAAYGGGGAGGVLGRQRSSGGGGAGAGAGAGAGGMYHSSPPRASFREPSYGVGAGNPPDLAAGGSPHYYQQHQHQQQFQYQQGGYMHSPPSPGYPYQAGPMAPPSPSRGLVRSRHGVVDQSFSRGLTSRKTRQQQQQQQQQQLQPLMLPAGGEEIGIDGGMDGLAPHSPHRGFSSSSDHAASAAAAATAGGLGGGFYDDGPPPTSSLMDLDEHDANRNSRLSSQQPQQQQLASVREPDHDASRWGATAGQAAWASWVLVFGFPRELREAVMNQFALFGSLQETVAEGNWLLLKYSTRAQAEKAVAQNGTLLHTEAPQGSRSSSNSSSSGLLLAVQRVTPDVIRRLGVAIGPLGGVEVVRRADRGNASVLSPHKHQPQENLLRQRRGSLGRGGRQGGRGVMSPEGFAINDSDLLKTPVVERPWWFLLWVAICSFFGWR
ncbi:hypothetical protein VYU27_010214, partial [Nannochloropsis oceanica]